MFIGDDLRRVRLSARSTRIWTPIAAAAVLLLLVGLQVTASVAGFQGPLHSLLSDYVATRKSATVSWVALGVALVGLSNRCRILALSVAAALDIAFAAERVLRGGLLTLGNGPMIVLYGIGLGGVAALDREPNEPRPFARSRTDICSSSRPRWATRGCASPRSCGWAVLDEYALLADHAPAQPSVMGSLVEAGRSCPQRPVALGLYRIALGGNGCRDLSTAQCPHWRLAESLP